MVASVVSSLVAFASFEGCRGVSVFVADFGGFPWPGDFCGAFLGFVRELRTALSVAGFGGFPCRTVSSGMKTSVVHGCVRELR